MPTEELITSLTEKQTRLKALIEKSGGAAPSGKTGDETFYTVEQIDSPSNNYSLRALYACYNLIYHGKQIITSPDPQGTAQDKEASKFRSKMLKTIDERTWAPKVVDDTTLELAGIYKELLGQAGPIAKEVIAGMNFAKRGLVNAALGIYGGLDGILAKQVDPITAEVEKNVQNYKTRLKKEQVIRTTLDLISSDFPKKASLAVLVNKETLSMEECLESEKQLKSLDDHIKTNDGHLTTAVTQMSTELMPLLSLEEAARSQTALLTAPSNTIESLKALHRTSLDKIKTHLANALEKEISKQLTLSFSDHTLQSPTNWKSLSLSEQKGYLESLNDKITALTQELNSKNVTHPELIAVRTRYIEKLTALQNEMQTTHLPQVTKQLKEEERLARQREFEASLSALNPFDADKQQKERDIELSLEREGEQASVLESETTTLSREKSTLDSEVRDTDAALQEEQRAVEGQLHSLGVTPENIQSTITETGETLSSEQDAHARLSKKESETIQRLTKLREDLGKTEQYDATIIEHLSSESLPKDLNWNQETIEAWKYKAGLTGAWSYMPRYYAIDSGDKTSLLKTIDDRISQLRSGLQKREKRISSLSERKTALERLSSRYASLQRDRANLQKQQGRSRELGVALSAKQQKFNAQNRYVSLLKAAKTDPELASQIIASKESIVEKISQREINPSQLVRAFQTAKTKEEFKSAMTAVGIPQKDADSFYGNYQKQRIVTRANSEERTQLVKLFFDASFDPSKLIALESNEAINSAYDALLHPSSVEELKTKMTAVGLPLGEGDANVHLLFAESQLIRLMTETEESFPSLHQQLSAQKGKILFAISNGIKQDKFKTKASLDALIRDLQDNTAEPSQLKAKMAQLGLQVDPHTPVSEIFAENQYKRLVKEADPILRVQLESSREHVIPILKALAKNQLEGSIPSALTTLNGLLNALSGAPTKTALKEALAHLGLPSGAPFPSQLFGETQHKRIQTTLSSLPETSDLKTLFSDKTAELRTVLGKLENSEACDAFINSLRDSNKNVLEIRAILRNNNIYRQGQGAHLRPAAKAVFAENQFNALLKQSKAKGLESFSASLEQARDSLISTFMKDLPEHFDGNSDPAPFQSRLNTIRELISSIQYDTPLATIREKITAAGVGKFISPETLFSELQVQRILQETDSDETRELHNQIAARRSEVRSELEKAIRREENPLTTPGEIDPFIQSISNIQQSGALSQEELSTRMEHVGLDHDDAESRALLFAETQYRRLLQKTDKEETREMHDQLTQRRSQVIEKLKVLSTPEEVDQLLGSALEGNRDHRDLRKPMYDLGLNGDSFENHDPLFASNQYQRILSTLDASSPLLARWKEGRGEIITALKTGMAKNRFTHVSHIDHFVKTVSGTLQKEPFPKSRDEIHSSFADLGLKEKEGELDSLFAKLQYQRLLVRAQAEGRTELKTLLETSQETVIEKLKKCDNQNAVDTLYDHVVSIDQDDVRLKTNLNALGCNNQTSEALYKENLSTSVANWARFVSFALATKNIIMAGVAFIVTALFRKTPSPSPASSSPSQKRRSSLAEQYTKHVPPTRPKTVANPRSKKKISVEGEQREKSPSTHPSSRGG